MVYEAPPDVKAAALIFDRIMGKTESIKEETHTVDVTQQVHIFIPDNSRANPERTLEDKIEARRRELALQAAPGQPFPESEPDAIETEFVHD
jgi:hypothetical protein